MSAVMIADDQDPGPGPREFPRFFFFLLYPNMLRLQKVHTGKTVQEIGVLQVEE